MTNEAPVNLPVKLCVNCIHLRKIEYYACFSPQLGISLVTGHVKDRPCESVRENPLCCGPKAKWFEPYSSSTQVNRDG